MTYNIGGNSDMIEHKKNGIEWILNLDNEEYNKLCNNAREKVLKEFDSRVMAEKYIDLYREILNEKE